MARHRFGDGRYRYFDRPLPEPIPELRTAFYCRLAPIANRWSGLLGGATDAFPLEHDELIERCRAAGQERPDAADPALRRGRLERAAPGPLRRRVLPLPGRLRAVGAGRGLRGRRVRPARAAPAGPEPRPRHHPAARRVRDLPDPGPAERGQARLPPRRHAPRRQHRHVAVSAPRWGSSSTTRAEPHCLGGQRLDRRPPGGVRVAARPGRREPLHAARLSPRRRDDPKRGGPCRRAGAVRAGARAARDRPGDRGPAAGARGDRRDRRARGARARALARARRPRPLPRARGDPLTRDRAGARRADGRRAARGGGGRAAADRAGDRAEARGAAARRARPRGRAATAARPPAEPRLGAGRQAWRPPSAARRPATCGAGATPASTSRWSAPRRIPRPCWRASPRCPRSSRWWSRPSGARSG